ncbi:MAG: YdeI/OmpD-associated family protein [Chitinophagaceae bacterium]|nr:YdeI/OmpD-associated family protein [Chitinophagaceae bacterium]
MALSPTQKLRIKSATTLLTVNAPADFKKNLGALPAGSKISDKEKDYQQIHWFVKDKAQMDKELNKILKLLKPEIICWIYYPKGTSGIQTDLTRDKGWDNLLKHEEFQWLSLISFDDTWSTFGMRLKNEADKKKEEKKAPRAIFEYVDPIKKTVRLPDDLAKSLKKEKKANEFFESLSFSNKKEYIEWVITAKREETRNERVSGSIERLLKKWKNPRNM